MSGHLSHIYFYDEYKQWRRRDATTCWKQLVDYQAWGWRIWTWSYYYLPWYSYALTFAKWEWYSTLCLWGGIHNKHFVEISHSQRDFALLSMLLPIMHLSKPKDWKQCFVWEFWGVIRGKARDSNHL